MLRIFVLAISLAMVASVAAGCSSDSKTKDATQTALAGSQAAETAIASGTPASALTASALSGAPGANTQVGAPGNTPGAGQQGSPADQGGTGSTPGSGATPGSAASPAPGSTPAPGETRTTPSAEPTPTVAATGGEGFTLDIPASPGGTFTVTVKLTGATGFRGFSVKLSFDAAVLRATSMDVGSVLGAGPFCPPALTPDGSAMLACTIVGPGAISADGSAVVVHFQALKSGSTPIHFVTYDEDNIEGTFLVGLNPAGEPVAVKVTTNDATVTVNP